MIKYYTKEGGRIRELDEPRTGCWIHIVPPFSQDELDELSQQYDVPLDFLTDSLDIDERSRYEREEDTRLILINTPLLNENKLDNDATYFTVPIGIILVPDHIITITSYEHPIVELFLNGRVRNFHPEEHQLFVLQLLEQNVYQFLVCLKRLNQQRNLIERELYDSSRNKELKQLLSIEKSLVYFVNSLSSNELLKLKMKRSDFLRIQKNEELMDLFEDIIIDNSQALEMSNIYTNILNGTMDAYGSIISNNLNITIQRLTMITIILMVPTLVASFYGMNVKLPLEDYPHTSWMLIVFSLVMSLLVAWYFQRKRMF